MDFLRRDSLLETIGDVNESSVAVSLEEFFVGNDDGGSIWCNIQNPIPPDRVFDILRGIRDRDRVADVVVLVTQYDGGKEEWPFSDTVYVITTAGADDVVSWFDPEHAPDEYWLAAKPEEFETLTIPEGMHAVGLWWD
jgi:hypothetical protein